MQNLILWTDRQTDGQTEREPFLSWFQLSTTFKNYILYTYTYINIYTYIYNDVPTNVLIYEIRTWCLLWIRVSMCEKFIKFSTMPPSKHFNTIPAHWKYLFRWRRTRKGAWRDPLIDPRRSLFSYFRLFFKQFHLVRKVTLSANIECALDPIISQEIWQGQKSKIYCKGNRIYIYSFTNWNV